MSALSVQMRLLDALNGVCEDPFARFADERRTG
jgi:hypothetical protein